MDGSHRLGQVVVVAISPYPGEEMPNGLPTVSISPPWENIPRQAYALTRYDAHSGIRTAITSSFWVRGDATLAMNSAIGKASTASTTVTSAATPIVRSAMVR